MERVFREHCFVSVYLILFSHVLLQQSKQLLPMLLKKFRWIYVTCDVVVGIVITGATELLNWCAATKSRRINDENTNWFC